MSEQASVTIDDVRRVAELANLELTAEEEPRMQRDLNAILGHIAQLNELDTTDIPADGAGGRDAGWGCAGSWGDVADGRGAALGGSCGGDGGGTGDGWPILQGSQGD